MTRTPDEIKKGMEYLSTRDPAKKLKLWQEGIVYDWQEDAAADALVLIQQLQDEKVEQAERIHQLEAERDAAVRDVHKGCETCKNSYLNDPKIDICRHFMLCQSLSMWEWRGVQKEDGNASD